MLLTAFIMMPLATIAANYSPGNVVFHDWDILRYYYYYFIVRFSDYPFVVQAAYIILLVSSLLVVVILISTVYIVGRNHVRKKYKNHIIDKCGTDLLKAFLNPEIVTNEQIERIVGRVEPKHKKVKYWRCRIWVEYLVSLLEEPESDEYHATENGKEARDKVFRMVSDALSLDAYVEYVIRFKSPGRIVTLLDAAKILGIEIPEALLSQLVNKKHDTLRLNSRLEYMHSASHNTYCYLEEGNEISYTTEVGMQLHELFKENSRRKRPMPSFAAMIRKQSDVRMKAFLTIEKSFWGEFDSKLLLAMLKHQSNECRYGGIVASGIFKRPEMEDVLVDMYEYQTEDLKCEILKSIFNINSGKQAGFFLSAYEHADSDTSRESALRCLWNYNEESRVLFNRLEAQIPEEGRKLFDHVKSPLIAGDFDLSIQFNHERIA